MRLHHPDSPRCRDVPASARHARFQSVATAYDVLRGKRPPSVQQGPGRTWDPAMEELLRRRRYQQMRNAAWHDPWEQSPGRGGGGAARHNWHASSADDEWKDRVIICVGLLVRP